MSFTGWMNSKIQRLDWLDISLTKLGVFAFTLMLAKLWEPLLSLEWYWYGAIFVLAKIRPLYRIFRK